MRESQIPHDATEDHVPNVAPSRVVSGEREFSLLALVTVILNNRRGIAATAILVCALVISVTILQPRTYTANASFMSDAGASSGSRLFALAAQLGVAIQGTGDTESPAFYADVLRSRPILRAAVETGYDLPGSGGVVQGDLVEHYDLREETRDLAVSRATEELSDNLAVRVDHETGLVKMSVRARLPALAQQIASRLLELVNAFNLETRQSRAAAERQFIERRLQYSRDELREAEVTLERFLQRNRSFESSPQLVFEHDRLSRQVAMRQQVHTGLVQAFEQARIDEVRNTPIVTVIEVPTQPVKPDSRRLLLKVVVAVVFGTMIGVGWSLWGAYLKEARAAGLREAEDLRSLGNEIVHDLKAPLRRVLGTARSGPSSEHP